MTFTTNFQELGSAKLPAIARRYLKDRGVSKEVSHANNLRFLTPEQTQQALGWRSEALLFPFDKHYGTARLFDPPKEGGKFRSPKGKPPRVYEPKLPGAFKGLTFDEVRSDPDQPLALIEGPAKDLSGVSHDILGVGLTGCWNWKSEGKPLPQLQKYEWRGRETTPIFDADVFTNPNVARAYLALGDYLSTKGARVLHLRLPDGGLDDFLAKHGRKAFDALPREPWEESAAVARLRAALWRTTEGGLAAEFVLRHGDDVRYDAEEDIWYCWNGLLWVPQSRRSPDVQERMKETVEHLYTTAAQSKDDKQKNLRHSWARASDRLNVMRNAAGIASSDPVLRAGMSDFDSDPHLIGARNGVIDLRTGKLLRHAREHLVSRALGVEFDPNKPCPRWERFISEIMLNDAEMVAFMQRVCGYLLLGGNPERRLFFLYGEGRNGKSVFIETVLRLFGDYGTPIKSELLMRQRVEREAEAAQPFLHALRGKRYISASEVGAGMRLDAANVKTWTGGDEITVRTNYATPVRFTVEGKFVFRCNHRPLADGGDKALLDRVVEIPFDLRLDEEKQDKTLHTTLAAELPGILNWCLVGCRDYLAKADLQLPAKVRRQIDRYRDEMDNVKKWMVERTVRDAKAHTRSASLYRSYENWCQQRSTPQAPMSPVSRNELNVRLEECGFRRKKSVGQKLWRGVALIGEQS